MSRYSLFSHPSFSVDVKTGTEGPAYDPYGYTEYTVYRNGVKIVLHGGLGCWLKVNDKTVCDDEALCHDKFTEIVGFSIVQMERIHSRLMSKCRKCGGKRFYESAGYETFTVCSACNAVHHYDFNESAII